MSEAEQRLRRAEELMEKVEGLRKRLEATDDPEGAIDILTELAEVAKEAEAEIAAAKRAADAHA